MWDRVRVSVLGIVKNLETHWSHTNCLFGAPDLHLSQKGSSLCILGFSITMMKGRSRKMEGMIGKQLIPIHSKGPTAKLKVLGLLHHVFLWFMLSCGACFKKVPHAGNIKWRTVEVLKCCPWAPCGAQCAWTPKQQTESWHWPREPEGAKTHMQHCHSQWAFWFLQVFCKKSPKIPVWACEINHDSTWQPSEIFSPLSCAEFIHHKNNPSMITWSKRSSHVSSADLRHLFQRCTGDMPKGLNCRKLDQDLRNRRNNSRVTSFPQGELHSPFTHISKAPLDQMLFQMMMEEQGQQRCSQTLIVFLHFWFSVCVAPAAGLFWHFTHCSPPKGFLMAPSDQIIVPTSTEKGCQGHCQILAFQFCFAAVHSNVSHLTRH